MVWMIQGSVPGTAEESIFLKMPGLALGPIEEKGHLV